MTLYLRDVTLASHKEQNRNTKPSLPMFQRQESRRGSPEPTSLRNKLRDRSACLEQQVLAWRGAGSPMLGGAGRGGGKGFAW